MCGIAGAFGPSPLTQQGVSKALASMKQRGPDAQGCNQYTLNKNTVTFLHTRLAIIDLDPRSDQPHERDGLCLTYNGEIYNFIELRCELSALGHRFETNSDTEVLLASYQQWGLNFIDHLEGMWAFALLDQKKGTLILSRDRFGEKPLYTWLKDGTLYFASEIKILSAMVGERPSVNVNHLRRYLVNGYKSLGKVVRHISMTSRNSLPRALRCSMHRQSLSPRLIGNFEQVSHRYRQKMRPHMPKSY